MLMPDVYISSDDHLLLWISAGILFIFFIGLFLIERNKKIK
jgi:hypothetical protein